MVGGVGSTDFVGQKRQTFNLGFGWRILLGDRGTLRVDLRDHLFSLDLISGLFARQAQAGKGPVELLGLQPDKA